MYSTYNIRVHNGGPPEISTSESSPRRTGTDIFDCALIIWATIYHH